jgi:hypothetical protein
MRFPAPPHPSLSIDDAQWRAEHAAQMAGAADTCATPAFAAA